MKYQDNHIELSVLERNAIPGSVAAYYVDDLEDLRHRVESSFGLQLLHEWQLFEQRSTTKGLAETLQDTEDFRATNTWDLGKLSVLLSRISD